MNNKSLVFKINVINCCKNCTAPKRHIGCHATCKDYLDERKLHDKIKNEYLKKSDIEQRLIEAEVARSRRTIKYR